jgi:hypothetical protein
MELPGISSETLILADTAEVAVAVSRVCGYTTGFAFDLIVRLRSAPQRIKLFEAMRARAVDELARPDAFKLGIQFGDGPKTSSFKLHPPGSTAPDVVLRLGSSAGGATDWTGTYWVWPLPPAGLITFACSWSTYDLDEEATMQAQPILDAATRARRLFD